MRVALDIDTPESPGWWINELGTELHDRRAGREGRKRFTRRSVESSRIRPGLDLLSDYLRGDPPLRQDIHADWAGPFRQYLRMGRLNFAKNLVSSPSNRLGIQGFRTAAADDQLGDREVHALMRRNKLKLKAREVHDYALGLGDGYAIVTPPDSRRSWSLITAESPLQCITAEDPATGETLAGLKMFRDHRAGVDYAYLFLPGELWVARAEVQASTLFGRRPFNLVDQWEWDEDKFDDIPGDRVAMHRFRNKDGVSEIEGFLDHLDRINDKLFNEWWIGKIQAFRQRALEVPDEEADEGDEDGDDESTPEDEDFSGIFTSAPDAMWQLPQGAKIWESQNVDVTPLVSSVKAELQWLAASASIPLHTITPDAANGSAEGASLMREEHVEKVQDRRDRFDGTWADVISDALAFQGDTERSDPAQIEAIWGPLERHSLAEKTTAAAAVKDVLPREIIWTDILQMDPADVQNRVEPAWAKDALWRDLPPGSTQPGS